MFNPTLHTYFVSNKCGLVHTNRIYNDYGLSHGQCEKTMFNLCGVRNSSGSAQCVCPASERRKRYITSCSLLSSPVICR